VRPSDPRRAENASLDEPARPQGIPTGIFTVWTRSGASGYIFRENAGKMRRLRRLAASREVFGFGLWRIHWWHPFKIE
jgi:hypothetical protein